MAKSNAATLTAAQVTAPAPVVKATPVAAVQAFRLEMAQALDGIASAQQSVAQLAIKARGVFETVDELKEAATAVYTARGVSAPGPRVSEWTAVYKAEALPEGAESMNLNVLAKACRELGRAAGETENRGRAPRAGGKAESAAGSADKSAHAPSPVKPLSPLAMIEAGINELKKTCTNKDRALLAILAELADMTGDVAALLAAKQ